MNKMVLCVLGVLAAGSTLLAQEGNLVINPGFENELGQNWRVPSWVKTTPQWKKWFEPTIAEGVSQDKNGKRSLLFQIDSGKTKKTSCQLIMKPNNRITLPAGMKDYTLQMWVKTAMPGIKGKVKHIGRVQFILHLYGNGKKSITKGLITPWYGDIPDWKLFRLDGTIPEGYDKCSLVLQFSGHSGTPLTQAWVDNLYFGPRLPKK